MNVQPPIPPMPPVTPFGSDDDAGFPPAHPHAFVGYGGLGRQIAGLFLTAAEHARAVFFDDFLFANGAPRAKPLADYLHEKHSECVWIIGLGYKHLRLKQKVVDDLLEAGRELPVLAHHRAHVHGSARLEPGVVVYPLANVDQEVVVGAGTLLNNSAVVSHNCLIGKCAFLSPGVILAGGARIGSRCFLGAGSVVSNGVGIGDEAVVGIGSVITRDVPPGTHLIGNPPRILSRALVLR